MKTVFDTDIHLYDECLSGAKENDTEFLQSLEGHFHCTSAFAEMVAVESNYWFVNETGVSAVERKFLMQLHLIPE